MALGWGLGGLNPREAALRTWLEIQEDEVFGRAAQLSYYFLLALFPLLLFLTALFGYFAGAGAGLQLRQNFMHSLGSMLPPSASALVRTTLDEIIDGSGAGKLSLGLLVTLWAASNGMGAISAALNTAYDVEESRGWLRERILAIALTIALSTLIVSSLALVLAGDWISDLAAEKFGFGEIFTGVWNLLQWPLALALVFLAFALIYHFAPNLPGRPWRWITPGAILGVTLWLLVSLGFRLYLQYFDSYSRTYGSLGAVIVLMLWFYFTSAAILIGGELNSEIEHYQRNSAKTEFPVNRRLRGVRVIRDIRGNKKSQEFHELH
jgi:membrane protein